MRSAIDDIPCRCARGASLDPNGNGHPQLPTNFLHISELSYYFRNRLAVLESSRRVRYGVDSLVNRVKPSLDGSAYALHEDYDAFVTHNALLANVPKQPSPDTDFKNQSSHTNHATTPIHSLRQGMQLSLHCWRLL